MRAWLSDLLIPREGALTPLAYWRERVLRATLVVGGAAGVIAYLPGVWFAARAGHLAVVLVDTAAYALILLMALRPSLPFNLRAGTLVVVPMGVGIALLSEGGSVAAGSVWIASFPVVAALFFGIRTAGRALLAQVAIIAGVGALVTLGWLDWGGALATYPQGPAITWFITGTNIVLLSAVLSLSGSVLLQALERTALEEGRARRDLERETDERLQLQGRLRQAEKLEAMGTLAGGIAHDFNNLLVPILLQTREALESLPIDHPARPGLEDVHLSATRARDMVRRILVFSRGAEVAREPVLLDREVSEVAALLQSTLPATVQIETHLQAAGAHVLADTSELNQVLMNLTLNSFQAMKGRPGVIRLTTRSRGAPDSSGAAPMQPASQVWVEVSDTGQGMPPEVLARVFEPFFTTRGGDGGTGLGLPTVFRIARDLGGSVTLESEPGQGTTARVELPLCSVGSAAPPQEPPRAGGARVAPIRRSDGGPVRVALVDDEVVVLRATGALLRRMGCEVTAFPTPELALASLRDPSEAVDILLTDFIMPGMTGMELARLAVEARPGLPVLLSSGNLEAPLSDAEGSSVVTGVLAKPFEGVELRLALESALDLTPG